MEIEWRPARWLGSSAEVTPTFPLFRPSKGAPEGYLLPLGLQKLQAKMMSLCASRLEGQPAHRSGSPAPTVRTRALPRTSPARTPASAYLGFILLPP